jgi:hypothetical protein
VAREDPERDCPTARGRPRNETVPGMGEGLESGLETLRDLQKVTLLLSSIMTQNT